MMITLGHVYLTAGADQEPLQHWELERMFDSYLDEEYGDTIIEGQEFNVKAMVRAMGSEVYDALLHRWLRLGMGLGHFTHSL